MLRTDLRIGQKVYFGRPNGQQTLAEVVRLNPSKAKLKTLEERGQIRDYPVGMIWGVPYNLISPADDDGKPTAAAPTPTRKIEFSPFQPHEDRAIMDAILSVYSALSPENLTADGELPRLEVHRRAASLQAKLRSLQAAIGHAVSESEVYEWDRQRRGFQANRKPAAMLQPLMELPPFRAGGANFTDRADGIGR